MSKHTKVQPAPAPSEPSNLELAEKAARLAISTLEAAVAGGDTAPQTTRELAGAVRALMSVDSEKRQQEKARKWTVATLPIEMAVERLKLLPADQLAHVINELARTNAQESVLG